MRDNISRRQVIGSLAATGSLAIVGSSSAATSNRDTYDIGVYLRKLADKHGAIRIGRGWFLNKEREKVVDTAGNRYSGYSQNIDPTEGSFVQQLHFEDGYSTLTETELKLDQEQRASIKSQHRSASGSAILVNRIRGKKAEREFTFDEFEQKGQKARIRSNAHRGRANSNPRRSRPKVTAEQSRKEPPVESETEVTNSVDANFTTTASTERTFNDADDGTEKLDSGIPGLNYVGANYKTSDNRCGVAQRSTYITVDASATAEVYSTFYLPSPKSDLNIQFSGDIHGVVSSIGMGGYVQAEGFVRDVSGEESVLLMDADMGIWELPFVSNNGDVNSQFGPGDGAVGDQPYLDYEFQRDSLRGNVEVGVRMTVAFNGFRGGVTVTNFIPAKNSSQPSGLGTEFFNISIN
ncbi:hypothetical protein [Natronoarchaeum rubrum]|uniref:hypothetical protein n=1 Tax=Natronoarchaeum rubrum TaxID=755311 RepID=UPI0021120FCF|nr:hypothetical protein [Natronoarchaeum rubrum]